MIFEAKQHFGSKVSVHVKLLLRFVLQRNSPLQRFMRSFARAYLCLHTTLLWDVARVFENTGKDFFAVVYCLMTRGY